MKKISIQQAASAIIAGGPDTKKIVEQAFLSSGAPDQKTFDDTVAGQVKLLKLNIEKAKNTPPQAAEDAKLDEREFEPLRKREVKADKNGSLHGFRPGQNYLVFLKAGETTVSESPPSTIGGDGPSRRKTVSIRSVYDPVEPKPQHFPERKTAVKKVSDKKDADSPPTKRKPTVKKKIKKAEEPSEG